MFFRKKINSDEDVDTNITNMVGEKLTNNQQLIIKYISLDKTMYCKLLINE